jgi:hypothetical protein
MNFQMRKAMIEMPTHPATTPPTIAPTFGPCFDDVELVLVIPDNAALTHEADAQEVQDATVCRQTSSGLHVGHEGGFVGQTTQRLKRGKPLKTKHICQCIAKL